MPHPFQAQPNVCQSCRGAHPFGHVADLVLMPHPFENVAKCSRPVPGNRHFDEMRDELCWEIGNADASDEEIIAHVAGCRRFWQAGCYAAPLAAVGAAQPRITASCS
eukprot:518546-Alexandrium_andersonii.AAC.1